MMEKVMIRQYFAYGSNLSEEQMRRRCPESRLIRPARLVGYRLDFGDWSKRWRGGVATVQPSVGEGVYGVIYDLTEACFSSLDMYESVPLMYVREQVSIIGVEESAGERLDDSLAVTYRFASPREASAPSPRYHGVIREAYERFGFPLDDLEQALARSAGGQTTRAAETDPLEQTRGTLDG